METHNNIDGVISVSHERELFDEPEIIIIFGSSNSGKTYLTENLVKRHHFRFYHIILCGNQNRLLEFPETRSKCELFKGDSDVIYNPFLDVDSYTKEKNGNKQLLVIIDDLMTEVGKSFIVSDIFSKGRHLNISIILILQQFCPIGNGGSTLYPQIKNNASLQIFTRSQSMGEISQIARRLEFEKKGQHFICNLYKKCVRNVKYGYFAVFLNAFDHNLRYATNLISEDGSDYITFHTQ